MNKPYMAAVAVLGAVAAGWGLLHLDIAGLDQNFWFLAAVTVFLGSRVGIEFSKHRIQVTISDTFVFLTLLLFGGAAAVLVAFAEAFLSSFRFSKLWLTRLFNGGLLAISTLGAYVTVLVFFGNPVEMLREPTGP